MRDLSSPEVNYLAEKQWSKPCCRWHDGRRSICDLMMSALSGPQFNEYRRAAGPCTPSVNAPLSASRVRDHHCERCRSSATIPTLLRNVRPKISMLSLVGWDGSSREPAKPKTISSSLGRLPRVAPATTRPQIPPHGTEPPFALVEICFTSSSRRTVWNDTYTRPPNCP